MSASRPFYIVLCLLCTAMSARSAEKPNDNRSNDSSQRIDTGYTREWGGKTFEEWRKDLKHHPDPSYRVRALMALPYFKQAADALPDVVGRLYDRDASPRVKAAQLLRMIQPHETDRTRIIAGLARSISHDPQSIIRYEAALSLQAFCPFNFKEKVEQDALQDLVLGLRSTSTYELREICIVTLILAGVDPKTGPNPRVTDALIWEANFKNEPTTQVRLKAIMALGAQGRPHDPQKLKDVMSVLRLKNNYQSSHAVIRIWTHVAIIALMENADKKDLDTIAEYLTNREASIREQAVMALGALEEKAQDYVNDILKMLKREKITAVRAAAAIALGRMKNTGPDVLKTLIGMTEEDSPETILLVWNACTGLVMLGVNNAEVMKAMNKVLEHKSLKEFQKKQIEKMIEELQNPRKKVVKEVPKALDKKAPPKRNKRR